MHLKFSILGILLTNFISTAAQSQDEFSGGSGGGSNRASLSFTLADPATEGAFAGATGKGDTKKYFISAVENVDLKGMFNGGTGRGDIAIVEWGWLNDPATANVYTGGSGRGDTSSFSFNVMKNPAANEVYKGGPGRGDFVFNKSDALQNGAASSIYAGGIGRGDISLHQMIPMEAGVSPRFAGGPGRGDHSLFNESTLVDISNQRRLNIEVAPQVENFKVQVRPNPTPNYFTVNIYSSADKDLRIRITDLSGRLIQEKKLNGGSQYIQIGDNWQNGVYFLEVIHGKERKVLRLLKLQ
jgi:hypothetical protein